MKSKYLVYSLILVNLISFTILITIHLTVPQDQTVLRAKVWRHRGGVPENKISAVTNSSKEGTLGVEVDVQWIEGELILGHSIEKAKEGKEKLSNLARVCSELKLNLWIDYKGPINAKVIHSFLKIYKDPFIKEFSFIETKSLLSAASLRLKGLPVSLWYQPRSSALKNFIYQTAFDAVVSFFKIDKISGNKLDYDHLKEKYSDKDLMIFTVKDPVELVIACKTPVKVILSPLASSSLPKECF